MTTTNNFLLTLNPILTPLILTPSFHNPNSNPNTVPNTHTHQNTQKGDSLPVDGDTKDTPQTGKDFVHDLRVSVRAELRGDDGLSDVCGRRKNSLNPWKKPQQSFTRCDGRVDEGPCCWETCSGSPLQKAPLPLLAVYILSSRQL